MAKTAIYEFDDLKNAAMPEKAAALINDPRFQKFVATRTGAAGGQTTPVHASKYLRGRCRVVSRHDLANNTLAQAEFRILVIEFDMWAKTTVERRHIGHTSLTPIAAILSCDPDFQKFASTRLGFKNGTTPNALVRELLFNTCHHRYKTRSTPTLGLAQLLTEFDAWLIENATESGQAS